MCLLKYTDSLLAYSIPDPVTNSAVGVNRVIAPFVACGDLNGFDSDMTYPVQVMMADY